MITLMKKFISEVISPRRAWLRAAMLAVCGAVAGLCITFPTYAGAFLQWFAYIPAAWVLFSMSRDEARLPRLLWRAYGYGFLFFMAEYLVNYHWFFSFYPLDFTGMSRASAAVVVAVAWIGLSFLASIAGGFVFLLFVLAARGGTAKRAPIVLPFAGGALFAVFEWVETIGWMGVPWGRAALGQLAFDSSPTVQIASVLGSYAVTFLIVTFSFLLAQAAISEKRGAMIRSSVAVLLAAADIVFGAVMLCVPENGRQIKVAAIQGNVSSRDKFQISSAETVAIYEKLIREAAASGAQLIVTPESAFPWDLGRDEKNLGVFRRIAHDYGVSIVLGHLEGIRDEQENVLALMYPDGSISDVRYSKRHLVPFGEYMPWRGFLSTVIPPLAEISMLEYDIKAGSGTEIMTLADGTRVGGLICFDSIYEELALASVRDGAEILLLGTNDSWFSDSAAVYMHNAQSRLRAVETGVPVVRAANTGISSLTDARGRVHGTLPPLVDGALCGTLTTGSASFYSRTGNIFVYLLIAFSLGTILSGAALTLSSRKKEKEKACASADRV